ncbi:MAG: InlB B-repeat-containing protein [Clostridiales bacterium]|nr:InlB B-repeat-containing protein [Clostridiales bacterium]
MKRFKRRAISILLAAMMILSSLPMGITAFATVSSTTASSVYVVVPETIYLTPSTSGATTSQYFVNNTFDSSSNSITLDAVNNAATGKIYFKNTDAEQVTITAEISQGSGTASVSGMTLGSAYTLSSGYGAYTIDKVTLSSGVTAGSSAQIKWTFAATLSDGTTDTYYAYTTCYSPYYTPVAAAASEIRTNGVAIQGVSWISGIHAIDSTYSYTVNYGTQTTVNLTYLSPLLGNLVTTAGTAASSYTGASSLSGSTYSSVNAAMYVATSNNSDNAENMASSYTGTLYVDTARNDNLNTIPNFTVGFLVSNVNKAGTLYYYVSDFTTALTSLPSNHYNNAQGFTAEGSTDFKTYTGNIFYGSAENSVYESISSGASKLIYNGTWDKSLTSLNTSATYAVKGAARLLGSNSSAYINCMSFVNVIRVYKTDLRNQIETCVESGWQENWCADSSAWSTYQTALQNAYYYLGKPDATSSEVTNAYNTLKTAYEALTKKTSQTVTAYHYALNKVLDDEGNWTGEYLVSKVCNNISGGTYRITSESATVAYGQNVTLSGYSSSSWSNYTCVGYVLSDEDDAVSLGDTLTGLPDYTSTSTSVTLARSDDDYVFGKTVVFYYIGDTVTLTIDANGGDIGNCNTSVTATVGTVFNLPTPTRIGYTFTGWTLTNNYGKLDATENTFTFGKYDNGATAGWEKAPTYTVTWVDADGTVLETDEDVEYGATPSYDKALPTKAADDQYTYTFAGWTPTVTTVTEDVTYTATYVETLNHYTVTWVDEDGTPIETDYDVAYGTMPSYDSAEPTKAATAQYTYTFEGWTPEVVTVTGDATYKATFKAIGNTYTVTWKNADGTVLETDTDVEYGATPEYNEATPTKAADDQYTYTFAGWTPTVTTVTEDVTYTATYVETLNHYTVTWVDEDGTPIETDYDVAYGTMPSYDSAEPTKAATAQYTYTFEGWTPEVVTVTGDATYKATFKAEAISTCEHHYVTFEGKAATCTEDGYTDWVECLFCGDIQVASEVIPALGHIDDDGDGYCDRCEEPVETTDDPSGSGSGSGSSSSTSSWDAFRCKMCDTYDEMKDKPVIGWIYAIVHFFVHLAHYISYLT